MLQEREKIRQRMSKRMQEIADRSVSKRKHVIAPKVVIKRKAAPKVGGPKEPPDVPPQDYIHLVSDDSGEDSGDVTYQAPAVQNPVSPARAMAAAASAAERATSGISRLVSRPMQYPRGHHLNPVVPLTVKSLWEEVETLYDRRLVDVPTCKTADCPMCKGPLMQQRHNLMKRLVFLEKLIWLGEGGV